MQIKKYQAPLLPEQKNLLAICALVAVAVGIINLFSNLFIAARVNALVGRKTTQVQLVNGSTFYISEQDRLFRYPQVIQRFVQNWIILTFSWDGKVPGSNAADKGVSVGSRKITTAANAATLLLEPRFAEASKPIIAELTPSDIFDGTVRSTIIVRYVSEPRQTAIGTWDVDVLAERVEVNQQTSETKSYPLNWTFTVRAVEIPKSPLGNDASGIDQKIYEFRSAGLEITQMAPFKPNQNQLP
ncbi:hypothetical protein ACQ4M3_20540 [Leptolyngbya sp. AN03gr2]|uniref:hypothetical protein n=1 Tax=unclassified Leptolyngbya TaxID=2650499 RepID=UPI003D316F0A